MLLKNSQYSQEKTSVGVNSTKEHYFKNTIFYGTPPVAASVYPLPQRYSILTLIFISVTFWSLIIIHKSMLYVKESIIIHGNFISRSSDRFTFVLKGATKLYFMYYSRVVINLFSMGL